MEERSIYAQSKLGAYSPLRSPARNVIVYTRRAIEETMQLWILLVSGSKGAPGYTNVQDP